MMKKTWIVFILMILGYGLCAQSIRGNLTLNIGKEIKLLGFKGLDSYLISETKIDSTGHFTLHYSREDYGIGFLVSSDEPPFFIVLNGENIEIKGQILNNIQRASITQGQENFLFQEYATKYPKREQALRAWRYLEHMYTKDSLFSVHSMPKQHIQKEIQRIINEENAFLKNLPNGSCLNWYLPTKKLISSVSTIAQQRPKEIPATIEAFRNMDYADPRLHKSGLLKNAIERHFWLIENSGLESEAVFNEMQRSIDKMIEHLILDEEKLNEVTGYLFDLLEQHSLFQASEYLALKLLNDSKCIINNDLSNRLETYRAMKIGTIAPEIDLDQNFTSASQKLKPRPKNLSDIKSKYTLLVFGAIWCPSCMNELAEVSYLYPTWKEKGIEVVFVSLDDNESEYKAFVKELPFISVCDFKKWNSPVIQDYYIFATPTMYILDRNRKILLRPHSAKHVDAWIDWYLD